MSDDIKQHTALLFSRPLTPESINEIVKINYGLVRKQLYKFYMVDNPDAISLGYEALYKAIITFDTVGTTSFSTYASIVIYNKLGTFVRFLNTEAMKPLLSYDEITEKYDLKSNDTADKQLLSDCGVKEINNTIADCIKHMKGSKLDIITIWIQSEFTMTHENIAKQAGVTQTYVTRIIRDFRIDLKSRLEAKK